MSNRPPPHLFVPDMDLAPDFAGHRVCTTCHAPSTGREDRHKLPDDPPDPKRLAAHDD